MKFWYTRNLTWQAKLLLPFEALYRLIIALRKQAYDYGILKTTALPVPVWVIGNLTVGGTGKTPLVIAIAQWLQTQGYKPGIISRGYGAKIKTYPHLVNLTDEAKSVGDEPLLLAEKTHCPVVIDPNRIRGASLLLTKEVDIILSDDGFQHYALQRDCNILVVDGERRYGNQHCLPAGPLRESLKANQRASLIVCNGGEPLPHEYAMKIKPTGIQSLTTSKVLKLTEFNKVHGVAGIGNPQRFFNLLVKLGFEVIPHSFSDHHAYSAQELNFGDELPLIMTEKDRVKCRTFAQAHWWTLLIESELPSAFWQALKLRLDHTNSLS